MRPQEKDGVERTGWMLGVWDPGACRRASHSCCAAVRCVRLCERIAITASNQVPAKALCIFRSCVTGRFEFSQVGRLGGAGAPGMRGTGRRGGGLPSPRAQPAAWLSTARA